MKNSNLTVTLSSLLLLTAAACSDSGDGGGDGGSAGTMMSNAGDGGGGGGGGMMASVALGKGNRPNIVAANRIDRLGRPAITAALISTFSPNTQNADRDAYNNAAPGAMQFAPTMKMSLGILDGLDEVCGNQLLAGDGADRYNALTNVLLDDQLYVNTESGTCGVYLGVEGEVVGAVPAGQGLCGGRTPLDDVVERSYSVLAAGALTGVDDTITEDDATHDVNEFPFLAAP